MRASNLFLAMALLATASLNLGCGSPRGGVGTFPAGDAATGCTPGGTSACMCADGRPGISLCSAEGVAGACVCGAAPVDASLPNDLGVIPGVDATARVDVVAPGMDVVAVGPGAVGAPCSRLTDCANGVCLPTGRCSRPCGGPNDCPGSWSCSSLPGLGPVCACTPRGAEVCNNLDDDCNGQVDEGTTRCGGQCVDLRTSNSNCGACGVSCGGGTSCVNGACACPPDRALACGGRCVDGRTDPSNCGSCGNVCSGGATCSNGVCQRTGMCPSSCSVSSQCAPCASPGETGTYCCVSGLCIYMAASTCNAPPVDSGLPDVSLPSDSGGLDVALD